MNVSVYVKRHEYFKEWMTQLVIGCNRLSHLAIVMGTKNETPRTFRVQSRDNVCERLLTEGGGAGEGVQEHLDIFHVPMMIVK